MVTPGVRCELVELLKYEDRKEEILGVKFKDPRVNWDPKDPKVRINSRQFKHRNFK